MTRDVSHGIARSFVLTRLETRFSVRAGRYPISMTSYHRLCCIRQRATRAISNAASEAFVSSTWRSMSRSASPMRCTLNAASPACFKGTGVRTGYRAGYPLGPFSPVGSSVPSTAARHAAETSNGPGDSVMARRGVTVRPINPSASTAARQHGSTAARRPNASSGSHRIISWSTSASRMTWPRSVRAGPQPNTCPTA